MPRQSLHALAFALFALNELNRTSFQQLASQLLAETGFPSPGVRSDAKTKWLRTLVRYGQGFCSDASFR